VLGLVADDLTGAGDAAVAFAEHGWRVLLHLDPRHLPETAAAARAVPTVVAVSTGARALTDEAAATVTADVVRTLRAVGADRVYLKIDSTVRGSVAGQVRGALHAWGRGAGTARAVICPAFPEHARTVVRGQVLVHGLPLEQSPAARDPVTPRATGDLTAIVPGAALGDPTQIGRVERLVLDAVNAADLDQIAEAVSGSDPGTVVVGSGGLAAALARCWSRGGPATLSTRPLGAQKVLIAASSLHPVTAGQLAHLRHSAAAGPVDVLTTARLPTTPGVAADELAERVAAALAHSRYGALIAIGGDGAAAILRRLAADQIVVDGAVSAGCPTGIVLGGTADGVRVVTKSGGFGDPATLTAIVSRLRSGTAGDSRPAPGAASVPLLPKDSS
jgi:uncharacterized protein YgbK (DUF1537 family)